MNRYFFTKDNAQAAAFGGTALCATDWYMKAIDSAKMQYPRSTTRRVEHAVSQWQKGSDERNPSIYLVILRPDTDILVTGGFMGNHGLTEEQFKGLPNYLEDFTDSQIDEFLEKLRVRKDELIEIREHERRLKSEYSNYRIL